MAYAEGTTVGADRTQQEIVAVLRRYGATGFMFGEDLGRGLVAFTAHERQVRFVLPLDVNREQFRYTPTRQRRSDDAMDKLVEGERKRRWRALLLAIKAKLEVVETGIASFEDEFLANLMLPDGSTVGEWVAPQVATAYGTGQMPAMLPGIDSAPLAIESCMTEPEIPRDVLRCPVHGIPDCSPMLNGCSIPNWRADAYLSGYRDGWSSAVLEGS